MNKPSTTRLLLVRHGETLHSHGDVICGAMEVSLTERGRHQASLLAHRLRQFHPDALYSSPQSRARETAQILGESLGLPTIACDGLREMDFGAWEGRNREHVKASAPLELHRWEAGSWMAHPPEGETQQQVIARGVLALHHILEQSGGGTLLLVSHKTILRLLLGHIMNWSIAQSRHISLAPAGLTIVDLRHDVASLMSVNDVAHLSADVVVPPGPSN